MGPDELKAIPRVGEKTAEIVNKAIKGSLND